MALNLQVVQVQRQHLKGSATLNFASQVSPLLHLSPGSGFMGSVLIFAFFVKSTWDTFSIVATIFSRRLGRKSWILHLHHCQHVSLHHRLFCETERQLQLSYSTHPSSCLDLLQAAHNRCVCVCLTVCVRERASTPEK